MRKIPTLFIRDPETNLRYVTRDVHPDCEWVMEGEGVATRKYDGTCVMYDGDRWWARREMKAGKPAPDEFVIVEVDEVTGKTVGWEPVEQSPFVRWHTEALFQVSGLRIFAGTYELCGPKINGNPEDFIEHDLLLHQEAEKLDVPLSWDLLAQYLRNHPQFEGIVWHHPDGRMAKIKNKDFPKEE